MENKFRLYPRGFLGSKIMPQNIRTSDPFFNKINHHQFNVASSTMGGGAIDTSPNIPGNPFVEGLYTDYIKNIDRTTSFEFKVNILQVALAAFGTLDFKEWVEVQYKILQTGDNHSRFIKDTIQFIQTGRRDMSLETWHSLLKMTDEGNQIGDIPKEISEYIENNNDLVEIIVDWCSKKNGLEDLLGTLHILFGNVKV